MFLSFSELLFLIISIGGILGQGEIPPNVATQVDNLIEDFMRAGNVPGFGLAIVKNQELEYSYTKGYGYADIENNMMANDSTLFSIGSITKSFTATIVVKTLSEMFPELGESVLDTPIRILAPGYNLTFIDRYRSEGVSFRDLLAHRVCTLPDYTGIFIGAFNFNSSTNILYRQRYAPSLCSVRNGFYYNNALIGMAGDVVAFMAKMEFNEMLEDLLRRINMTDTTYIKIDDDHNNMPGRSVPYIWKDDQFMRYNTEIMKTVVIVNAAGGILSSSGDMSKYMKFHLNSGMVGDDQIVSKEAIQWLSRISTITAYGTLKSEDNPETNIDFSVGYALCLDVGVYDGWLRIGHGGYLPPYDSLLSLYPGQGLGVFTTLSGPGTFSATNTTMQLLHNQLFDILQGTNQTRKFNFSKANRVYGPFNPFPNKSTTTNIDKATKENFMLLQENVIGSFGNGLNGEINISMKQNEIGEQQAYFEYGIWGRGFLSQTSNVTFEILLETDYWQANWANQLGPSVFAITFLDVNTLEYIVDGSVATDSYVRNVSVDTLPEIPWSPNSCGLKNLK